MKQKYFKETAVTVDSSNGDQIIFWFCHVLQFTVLSVTEGIYLHIAPGIKSL